MSVCRADSGGRWRNIVQSMRWRGLRNGALIQRIRDDPFDVFITVDKGMPFQQNLRNLPFGMIVIRARTNDAEVIVAFVPRVRKVLLTIKPGDVVIVNETTD